MTTRTEARPWTTYSAIVGSVVARRRRELGLGQAQFAQNLAISQPTYSRIERGAAPALLPLQLRDPHAEEREYDQRKAPEQRNAERVPVHVRPPAARRTSRSSSPASRAAASALATYTGAPVGWSSSR